MSRSRFEKILPKIRLFITQTKTYLKNKFENTLIKIRRSKNETKIFYTYEQVLENLKGKDAISRYSTQDILNRIAEYAKTNGSTIGLSFAGENLSGIDLSREKIQQELKDKGGSKEIPPPWYSGDLKQFKLCRRADIIADAANLDTSEIISKKAINLEGVNFSNAILVCTNLEGADLNNANFQGARLHYAILSYAHLHDANFTDARLNNADLTGAYLQNANFTWAILRGAIINKCSLYHIKLDKTEMEREQVEHVWEEMQAREEKRSSKHSRRHYADASIAYNRLKNNFVSIGRHDDAGWAFIKEKQMERNTHKRFGTKWFLNLFMDISCGYGEQPGKVFFLIFGIVMLFGFIYLFLGGIKTADNMDVDWYDNFIFSLGAFVTLGFPDLIPETYFIRIISCVEYAVGVSFFALLMYSLGQRITGH